MKEKKQNENKAISKEQELKDEAWAISQVLFDAQESLKIVEYFIIEGKSIDAYNVYMNPYWRFSMSVFVDHVLLKLNILFARKEHFSIYRLIEKLKSGKEFAGVVPEQTIIQWENEVGRLQKTYRKINLQRNKRIAHKDRNPGKKLGEPITINELKELVQLVQNIVREIYQFTIQSSFQVENPIGSPVESLRQIIVLLDEHWRSIMTPLYKQAKEAGLTDELPPRER